MATIKITVAKRTVNRDLIRDYSSNTSESFGLCERYEDGQEFLLEGFPERPEGFCDWAWNDIHRDVIALWTGGNFPWMRQPGTAVTCCTDGLRPVIFKVERIE